MTLFQFGLEQTQDIPDLVVNGGQNDLRYAVWILVGVGILLGILAVLWTLRVFFRWRATAQHGTFETTTLLVTVPRFRHKEQTERAGTKEQMQEALASAESFFGAIGGLKAEHGFHPWLFGRHDEMSFEVVAINKEIRFYVTMPREMEQTVMQQLSAAYPDAFPEPVEDYNIFAPDSVILGSYLVFKREHAFPIKTFRKMDKDPLDAITNVLSKVPEGEGAAFQFVVRSAPKHWRSRGIAIAQRMLSGMTLEEAIKGAKKSKTNIGELTGFSKAEEKKPEEQHKLSPLEEETVKGLEEKASKAGLDVCIRLVVAAKSADSAHTTLAGMINAFSTYNIYQYGNSFVKVVPPFKQRLIRRFIYRSFDERNKIVLNAEELASVWHLPTAWTETPGIKWLGARKGAAPSNVPTGPEMGGQIDLGYNLYRGVRTPIRVAGPGGSRSTSVFRAPRRAPTSGSPFGRALTGRSPSAWRTSSPRRDSTTRTSSRAGCRAGTTGPTTPGRGTSAIARSCSGTVDRMTSPRAPAYRLPAWWSSRRPSEPRAARSQSGTRP